MKLRNLQNFDKINLIWRHSCYNETKRNIIINNKRNTEGSGKKMGRLNNVSIV